MENVYALWLSRTAANVQHRGESVSAALELKKLRDVRLKWSMRKIALELGFQGGSSYQRYEDDTTYPDKLPDNFVSKLLEILPGKGNPPIAFDEVLRLGRLHKLVIKNEPQGIILSGLRGTLPKTAPLIRADQIEMLRNEKDSVTNAAERFSIGEHFSEDAFWLTVTDSSMSPEISEGDLIACDPQVTARPGDFVLVRIASELTTVVRRYRDKEVRSDGSRVIEYMPVNTSYPTFIVDSPDGAKVYGTIVQHLRTFR